MQREIKTRKRKRERVPMSQMSWQQVSTSGAEEVNPRHREQVPAEARGQINPS